MKLLILLSVLSLLILACDMSMSNWGSDSIVGEGDATTSKQPAGAPIMTGRDVRAAILERQADANKVRWRAHDGTKYRFSGSVLSVVPKDELTLREIESGSCWGKLFRGDIESCETEWITEVSVRSYPGAPLFCVFKGDAPAGVADLEIGAWALLEGKFSLAWADFKGINRNGDEQFTLDDCRVIESNYQPTPIPITTVTPVPTPTPTPAPLSFSEFEMKVDELTNNADFRGYAHLSVLSKDTAYDEEYQNRFRSRVLSDGVLDTAFLEQDYVPLIADKDFQFNALLRLYETNPNGFSLLLTCWENGGWVFDWPVMECIYRP